MKAETEQTTHLKASKGDEAVEKLELAKGSALAASRKAGVEAWTGSETWW